MVDSPPQPVDTACSSAVRCPECESPAFSLIDAIGDYWTVECLHCEEMVLSVLDPSLTDQLHSPSKYEVTD